MILNIRHTGLVVRDLERSITFYTALGFELWKRELETGLFIETVVGIPEAKLEWAKMHSPDGHLIELLHYHSNADQRPVLRAPSNQLGCSHVAFTVDNISATCKLINQLGGSIVNSPVKCNAEKVSVAYCHDIDGILLELVEELDNLG
jgi:catechol 2,3-dioxygenase-like lactoylglutathione lyase family enzyme